MRKIKEMLRLHFEVGLSNREISRSLSVSHSTVNDLLGRFQVAGMAWPLPEDVDEAALEAALYSGNTGKSRRCPEPDWNQVHRELSRKGVTLQLLWFKYKDRRPDGYQYSQFCERYRFWSGKLDLVMRQEHRAGEKVFVDYAGQSIPLTDPRTEEVTEVPVFVATLGASRNPTYLDMAAHYGTAVIPARLRRPRDKAKVESAVGVVERQVLAPLRNRTFFNLADLNRAIGELVARLNSRPFQKLEGSRRSLFEDLDGPALRRLPGRRYEFAEWKKARVNIDYHVEVDHNYYSVPYALVRKEVEVRLTLGTVEALHMPEVHRRQRDRTPSRLIAEAQGHRVKVSQRRPNRAVTCCAPPRGPRAEGLC